MVNKLDGLATSEVSKDNTPVEGVKNSEFSCTKKVIAVATLAILGGGCAVTFGPIVAVGVIAAPAFGIGMYKVTNYVALKTRLAKELEGKEIRRLDEEIKRLEEIVRKAKEGAKVKPQGSSLAAKANAAGTGQAASGKESSSDKTIKANKSDTNLKKSEEAAKARAAARSAADAKAAQAKEAEAKRQAATKPPKGKEKVDFNHQGPLVPTGQAGPATGGAGAAAAPPKFFPSKGLPNRGSDCFLNSCMQMIMRVETFKNALLILDEDHELRLFGDFIRKYESGDEITQLDVFALRVLLFKISLKKEDPIINDFLNKYKSNSLQQIDMNNLNNSELYKPQKKLDGEKRDDIFYINEQHDAVEVFKLLAGRLDANLPIFKNETETLYVDIPADRIQHFERPSNSTKTWGNIELDIDPKTNFQQLVNNYFDEHYDHNDKTLFGDFGRRLHVVHSKKRFDVNPQDFYITLKRFGVMGGKNSNTVTIPDEIEIPSPLGDEYPKERYELDSFIIHLGSTTRGGHYIYYQYDKDSQTWIEFNDSRVSQLTNEEIKGIKHTAYMYHYIKK